MERLSTTRVDMYQAFTGSTADPSMNSQPINDSHFLHFQRPQCKIPQINTLE